MAKATGAEAEMVLDKFVELMFKLMMDHHQRHVSELDLTMSQAQALKLLRRKSLCTGELAAELQISAPAVTQLTDRLARKRLIERRAVDGDRRSVMLTLTEMGRRTIDKFRERRNDIFSTALVNLSEEDRVNVVLALGKVVAALETFDSQAAAEKNGASKSISRARKHQQAVRG